MSGLIYVMPPVPPWERRAWGMGTAGLVEKLKATDQLRPTLTALFCCKLGPAANMTRCQRWVSELSSAFFHLLEHTLHQNDRCPLDAADGGVELVLSTDRRHGDRNRICLSPSSSAPRSRVGFWPKNFPEMENDECRKLICRWPIRKIDPYILSHCMTTAIMTICCISCSGSTKTRKKVGNDVNFLQAMKKAVPGNTIIVQVARMFWF